MRRILLAAAVALAAISSVPPAFAGVTLNGPGLNGLTINGLTINGQSLNGQSFGTNPLAGSVEQVTSIVLPSGEVIR